MEMQNNLAQPTFFSRHYNKYWEDISKIIKAAFPKIQHVT